MSFINFVFGIPLGWLFYFCYTVVGNYGISILVFTLSIKGILFPVSLLSHINSIKMVKLSPMLEDIKIRCSDDPKVYIQEIKKLYKRERYSSFVSTLPLLLQILILLGVINVIYNPLQHLLRIDQTTIKALTEKAVLLTNNPPNFNQFKIMELVRDDPYSFFSLADKDVIANIMYFNLDFMGMNLFDVPVFNSPLMLVVIASCLSALLMCALQNKIDVLQRQQSFWGKWGVTVFLVVFSGYFTFVMPVVLGIYWIASNLLTIIVLFICNGIYNPQKYIHYEGSSQKKFKLSKAEKLAEKQEKSIAKSKQKLDISRFYANKKQLVFYSEKSGFYKYFSGIIDYVLENSDITVHYVTSDLHDQVFDFQRPRFENYYVAGHGLIPFMMRMDADMVIMTMPDLQQYHIKRSLVRTDIEYVYLDHGMTSFHLMLRQGALDHYDTIFCYGPNHIEEIRAMEKVYNLPAKKLIKTGYGLLDSLLKNVEEMDKIENKVKKILIAPSWQKDNLLEICLKETLEPLMTSNYQIIIRPHPEFIKRFPNKMKAIIAQYGNREADGLIIESDFSSNKTVYTADLIITDWSSIAQEFSYATKKPSIFINTPMKIINPEYQKIPLIPLDISLRNEIGISIDIENLWQLPALVDKLFKEQAYFRERIDRVLEKNIFNIGTSSQVSGEYIIQTIQSKKG